MKLIQIQFITLQLWEQRFPQLLYRQHRTAKMHANYDLFDMKIYWKLRNVWENSTRTSRFHVFHAIKHHVKHISTSSGNFFSMKPPCNLTILLNLFAVPFQQFHRLYQTLYAANFIKYRVFYNLCLFACLLISKAHKVRDMFHIKLQIYEPRCHRHMHHNLSNEKAPRRDPCLSFSWKIGVNFLATICFKVISLQTKYHEFRSALN